MDNKIQAQYEKLDFGTVITTSSYDTIEVEIDPEVMIDDYALAVAHDLQRRNPVRYQAIEAQMGEGETIAESLKTYIRGLLAIRVEMVNDSCSVWRQAKALRIPPYVQFVLSQIGECIDMERGLKFVPVLQLEYDVAELQRLSTLLAPFELDGAVLLRDAFPREKMGDKEVMSFAIIGDYIKSINKSHPAKSYVCAFLGMKLKEETQLKSLYRISYDNLDFVKTMLLDEVARW